MYGAIIGDILGSIYEFDNLKTDEPEKINLKTPDCFFTDDSVLTVAVADAILNGFDYGKSIHVWARKFPRAGYGGRFVEWVQSNDPKPYNSWGNGSAMRVSPVGWAFDTLEKTLAEAEKSAAVTHNHPEGIKGAQATAAAIFLARTGKSKTEIKQFIEKEFNYDLNRTIGEIRPVYQFNESCQGTVPESIIVFLESKDFAHAMQLAISIGGDTDTIGAITGGIAEAFYGPVPQDLLKFAENRLPRSLKAVIGNFYKRNKLSSF